MFPDRPGPPEPPALKAFKVSRAFAAPPAQREPPALPELPAQRALPEPPELRVSKVCKAT